MASAANASIPREEIIRKLIGAWRLVSWSETKEDGMIDYPLGKDAIGQLIYSADGHIAAQRARKDMPPLHDEDWRSASMPESSRAWKSYFGYFGTFSIDDDEKAVIHHVEGSWFPNLAHTDQTRMFRFIGDELVLDADTAWGNVHIVWEKAPDQSARI
jgi:hypothetical protein